MPRLSLLRATLLLAPCAMLIPIAMDIFVSGVPAMTAQLETTEQEIQWILVLFMLGTGIGQPFIGPVCDRIGRRMTMLLSVFLFTASSIACSAATGLGPLAAARFFQGIGACGALVATFAIIRDSFETKQTYVMFCLMGGIGALMPMIAPLFGTWLMELTASWRSNFEFLAVFGAFTFCCLVFRLPETKPESNSRRMSSLQSYQKIFRHPSFLIFSFSGLTAMTQLYLYFSVGNFLLIGQLGVSETTYSLLFGLNALVYLLGNALSTLLQRVMDAAGIVSTGVVFVLTGSASMLGLEVRYGLSAEVVVLCNLIMTAGVGIMIGPSTGAAIQPFSQLAGTASGAFGALQYGGAAIVGFLVTRFPIVSSLSLAGPMCIMATLTIIGLFATAAGRRRAEEEGLAVPIQ